MSILVVRYVRDIATISRIRACQGLRRFIAEERVDDASELYSEIWRNSVPHLYELFRAIAHKFVVIREGLKPSGLADGKAPRLRRICSNGFADRSDTGSVGEREVSLIEQTFGRSDRDLSRDRRLVILVRCLTELIIHGERHERIRGYRTCSRMAAIWFVRR